MSQMITAALTVNGTRHSVTADDETPLLWILREHLKLTGTKYGCGVGQCGACTFYDYHVPRMKDLPELQIQLIQTLNHPTGAGQMGTPLVAPAISNAVYGLTGVRLRQQPMLAERMQQALIERETRFA